jgi:hypothetical protein
VEVDAIEPDELRAIAEQCIVQHIDHDLLERTRQLKKPSVSRCP